MVVGGLLESGCWILTIPVHEFFSLYDKRAITVINSFLRTAMMEVCADIDDGWLGASNMRDGNRDEESVAISCGWKRA